MLRLASGFYGRLVEEVCPHGADNICGETHTAKIWDLCDGERECTLAVSNSFLGDTCPGIYKYLEVTYTCEGNCIIFLLCSIKLDSLNRILAHPDGKLPSMVKKK